MTKMKVLLVAVLATAIAASSAVGAQLNFGGDLGFVLFDVSSGSGIQPSRDSLGTAVPKPYGDTTGRVNMYLMSHGVGLYFNAQLNDNVSINVLADCGGTSTGATPSLGKKLGTQQGTGTLKAINFPEANIAVMLPWQVQMTTGIIRPIFSEDYGEKKSYQEHNRMHKSSANGYGGEWHDLGIELYKSFEPGGGFSIPAYAYLLAGEQMFGDDNSNKALMFHVAPAFWKLRVLGSYGFGKEGADGELEPWSRYAVGLGGDFGPVYFRTEFFGGSWAGAEVLNRRPEGGVDTTTYDRKPTAWYVTAGVNIIPDKLGFNLVYDQSSPDWTTWGKLGYTTGSSNATNMYNGKAIGESYTTIGATIQYWVIPGSALMLEYNRGMWKVGDGTLCKLGFNRFTLGWRTVF
jgi:hypothetical protein